LICPDINCYLKKYGPFNGGSKTVAGLQSALRFVAAAAFREPRRFFLS
jgi:hypothetical protein